MSKRKPTRIKQRGRANKAVRFFTLKPRAVVALSLLLSLVGTAAVLARRGSLTPNAKPAASSSGAASSPASSPSPEPQTQPLNLSKEYIYAGGRLIATEEPPGTPPPTCTFTLSSTSQSFAASGGTGSVTVTTTTGCAWTAVSNDAWITITSGATGSGSGPVNYSVANYTLTTQRTGTLTIAGQTFTVTQAGAAPACSFSLSATTQSFTSSGGMGSVTVTTQTGCAWTALSNNAWITITSGASASDSGMVSYSVEASSLTTQRIGTMTIAGQTFTVTQAGAPAGSDNAGFVGQNVPTTLTQGQGQSVTIAMSNTGTTTWTSGSYVLRSQTPAGNTRWGLSEVALPVASVAPSTTVSFTFTITAPGTAGIYDFQWQMFKVGGAYFGVMTTDVLIDVSGGTDIPPAPSNLTATASGSNINLSWQNNTQSNYIGIERKIGSGSWLQIATVAQTATSYTDPSLAAGSYAYRVRCFVGNGTASPYSNEASASIGGTAPPAPTNLVASLGTGLQVNLTWTDNSTNETGFKIERKTSVETSYSFLANVGAGAGTGQINYTDTTVLASTTYTYRVLAYNGTLQSAFATSGSVTTPPPPPPAAPSDLTGTAVSSTQVNLTWLDNSTNEDGFKIERKTGTGAFSVIATLPTHTGTGSMSYSDTTAAASTTYTYQVRSFNAAGGDSTPSNQVTVTTPAAPVAPNAPTGLTATAASSSQINLTWTDNSTNEDGFKIERDSGAGFVEIASTPANATATGSFSNTGLTASTTYTYQVRAYAGTLFSGYAGPASASTQAAGGGAPCPTMSTVSGDGVYGYIEGVGTAAEWRKPVGGVVAKDPATGLYALFIADTENHRIRKVLLEGASIGQSSSIAGDGVAGYSEGSGVPKNARYNNPRGIAAITDLSGIVTALVIADTSNHRIRKLAWNGSAWTSSNLSGAGTAGLKNVSNNGQFCQFNAPQGLVVASDGFIYVADTGNQAIRRVDPSNGGASTTVGVGTFTSPVGITASGTSGGPLYVSAAGSHRIYQVTTAGAVTAIAGSGAAGFADGTGAAAVFNTPAQLVWANTASGAALFIADQFNNRIRRLVIATSAVNTHAGSGTAGFADGSCTAAQFNAPRGVAYLSTSGAVYVIDTSNNRIRKGQ